MWRRLKNFLVGISTYADLSPDIRTKQQVRQFLRQRSALSLDDWYIEFWQAQSISFVVVEFFCIQLSEHTQLEITRMQPGDRLVADLRLPLICWFDWEITFAEAFQETFGVSLGDTFSFDDFETVQDLMLFLDCQLVSMNCF